MADDIVLTPSGKKRIEVELERLRSIEMPLLSERIRQARALGDLSENFDYIDAKRQQGFLNGKIKDLEATLDRAQIVEETTGGDTVSLGSSVTVRDLDEDLEEVYTLVGATDSDPSNGKISVGSPIGKALVGRKVGDSVTVQTPGGQFTLEILSLS